MAGLINMYLSLLTQAKNRNVQYISAVSQLQVSGMFVSGEFCCFLLFFLAVFLVCLAVCCSDKATEAPDQYKTCALPCKQVKDVTHSTDLCKQL